MAVVIVIMGLVMMTVLPALTAVRSANQSSLTTSNMRSLMLATAAFVQANGCLPCPAIPGGTMGNFGKLGNAAGAGCGTCPRAEGLPPFVALGVPASMAHDGWGHWITMRVDTALTVLPNNPGTSFVPPWAICTATDASKGLCTKDTSSKGLCAALSNASAAIEVKVPQGASQFAALIFVSHGKDGYGSYAADPVVSGSLPFPAEGYAACSAYGGFAQCNSVQANSKTFYDSPRYTGSNDTYDDVLVFANRNALVSMLGNGACNTNYPP